MLTLLVITIAYAIIIKYHNISFYQIKALINCCTACLGNDIIKSMYIHYRYNYCIDSSN